MTAWRLFTSFHTLGRLRTTVGAGSRRHCRYMSTISLHKKTENIENLLCMLSSVHVFSCLTAGKIYKFYVLHTNSQRAHTQQPFHIVMCVNDDNDGDVAERLCTTQLRATMPLAPEHFRREQGFSELQKFSGSFSQRTLPYTIIIYMHEMRAAVRSPYLTQIYIRFSLQCVWVRRYTKDWMWRMDGWMVEPRARDARDATTCRDNVALLCMMAMRVQHCYL